MHNSCCPLTEVISYGVRKCIVNFVSAANMKCASVGQCRNSRRATDQVDDESDREGKKFLQLSVCVPKENVLDKPDKPCTSRKKCYNLLCRIR
jgi:hypothetical protein